MKKYHTGMIRPIDDLGRICIPSEIRESLSLQKGDKLAMALDGDGNIILRPDRNHCTICGADLDDITAIANGHKICRPCVEKITDAGKLAKSLGGSL